MYEDIWALQGTAPDPYGYAATASGPPIDDLVGPPAGVLDIYYDGTPMDAAVSQAHGGAGSVKRGGVAAFLVRGDVHAAALALIGGWMIKKFVED